MERSVEHAPPPPPPVDAWSRRLATGAADDCVLIGAGEAVPSVRTRAPVLIAGETLEGPLLAMRSHVVCIDGKIGVGKSTLGRAFDRVARALGVDVHFEREKRQERMLAQFVGDPASYGALFQMAMLEDAVNRQHTCEVLAARGALALLERGPVGNSVFAALNHSLGNISARDYAFYGCALPEAPFGATSVLLYLHVSHAVALRRMGVRNDPAEQGYDGAYLLALDDAYFTRMVRELAGGAPIAPVPWSHQIEQLCDGAAAADTLTLSLSATPVPRVAPDVVAVARYASAAARGTRPRLVVADAVGADAAAAAAETYDAMREWETRPSPLETRWASAGTERACAHAEPRARTFLWSVYEEAVRVGSHETRASFQHALVCALCALDDVTLVGLV